jgi:hypothetical protein
MTIIFNNIFTFSRNHISSSQFKRCLDLVSILLLVLFYLQSSFKADVPLIGDETYHVTDSVADGDLNSINPYSPEYHFLGHPPAYRVSLLLWFKIFPKNYVYAHHHAMVFTLLTIFLFYLILFSQFSWLTAIAGAITLQHLPYFNAYGSLCFANIPEISLFLLCFYFSIKKNALLTSISFFLLVMMRESGVAFGIAFIFTEYILSNFNLQSLRKSIIVTLPGFTGLSLFFAFTYFNYEHLSIHPYATGGLGHLEKSHSFFSINQTKIDTLTAMIHGIKSSIPINPLWLLLISFLSFFRFRKIINLKTIESLTITSLVSFLFFVFLFLYGDLALRDVGLLIIYILLILITTIEILIPKYKSIVTTIALLSLFLMIPDYNLENTEYAERVHYAKIANELESRFKDKSICLPLPISNMPQKIHGLYKIPLVFKSLHFDISKCDIVSLFKFQRRSDSDTILKIVDENKLSPQLEDVYRDRWLKVYDLTLYKK